MNQSEKHRYYASREWALLKRQVRERSGGKCERCHNGNHEATHHLTYERFGRELLEDLQAVCAPCHEFLSGNTDIDPAKAPAQQLRRRIYPEPVFIYPAGLMDFWWGTISDPDVKPTRALAECIDRVADAIIPISNTEDILWEGDVKVGVVPHPHHPCTSYWAGRSLNYRFAISKKLGFETIIASYIHMAWISRRPVVMAALFGPGDSDWEVFDLKELNKEDRLAIDDVLVNLDLEQSD